MDSEMDLYCQIHALTMKMETNHRMRDKALELRLLLKDKNAQSQCDAQIKASERYMNYFSQELRRIKQSHARPDTSQRDSLVSDGSGAIEAEEEAEEEAEIEEELKRLEEIARIAEKVSRIKEPQNSLLETDQEKKKTPDTSHSVVVDQEDERDALASEKYSNLDLLMADTPIHKEKISLKLYQLEYKVNVEKQVQKGIYNLTRTLQASETVDRKRIEDLENKQTESNEKMALLECSIRKYKTLCLGQENTQLKNSSRVEQPAARRPISGSLQLKVIEGRELAHALTRMFKASQTAVMIKIDGNVQGHTRLSRDDQWSDTFEMDVEKSTEVELQVYDQTSTHTLPIGLLWLNLSEISEQLQKQASAQEQENPHQVPEKTSQSSQGSVHECKKKMQRSEAQTPTQTIVAWFDIEPMGRLLLNISFVHEPRKKRPMYMLDRAGAVRGHHREIYEKNGHVFITRRFYHIMRCGLCSELMVKFIFRCKECGFSCHKQCYPNIVTKCMSQSSELVLHDKQEELKHHVPHRFGPLTILGANWCCHCGMLLTIGFRGAQRCLECGVACHTKCALFVPDFCGMSMDKANKMLNEMKAANERKLFQLENSIPQPSLSSDSSHENSCISQSPLSTLCSIEVYVSSPKPSKKGGASRLLSTFKEAVLHHSGTKSSRFSSATLSPKTSISHLTEYAGSVKDSKKTTSLIDQKFGLSDFNFLAVLGKGNFGKVMLAEEKYTRELYAIKILKKRFILDNKEMESLQSEKHVFQLANKENHPFLARLHSTFQTETRVYYAMEYISGGDLMMHIQRDKFSEKRAKFYGCEVLLALEHLHKHGIIYRDLKLDNIMLCLDGHIKLVDYGLCKENMWYQSTTKTFCGTPEFMAPEIVLELPYGRSVDWWTLGVLLYEMLLGQSPFKGEDEDEIFHSILEDEILYPINMPKNSISICQRLLERNVTKRLGSSEEGSEEIKAHPFFQDINWEDFREKRVLPPFLPTIHGRADISNFDEEFTKNIPVLTPLGTKVLPEEQQQFEGFAHVAEWVMEGL
ncbi:kinase-like domain-containing protein [Spinellus fusiger]|nr:kinase-like domain-containing protein [Spinellus fusiger]